MDMDHRFDKIEEKLDTIRSELHKVAVDHSERLIKLETTQKGFISVLTLLFTAVLGVIVNLFTRS
jgi:hypothetical protein